MVILRERQAEAERRKIVKEQNQKLPACFGTYEESDEECDGGPCVFRKRCGAFTRYLGVERKRSTSFLTIEDDRSIPKVSHTSFMRFCEQLLRDEANNQIKKQRVKNVDPDRDKRKDGPSIKAKRRSRATKARRAKRKRNELLVVFERFKVEFETGLKIRTFAASDQIISTGQFYQFDRLKTSDYIGIRCKTNRGVDFPLVVLKLKTSTEAFDVKLPFTTKELRKLLSRSSFSKLKPEDKIEGRLKTIIKNAKQPTLALLCDELVKAVNGNKIELPST